jgi:ribosomal protein S18 acetylase RimI-like enzyme
LGKDPQAGYLHTMAIRRQFAGRGLGEELMAFAEKYFFEKGLEKLRLDCSAENKKICEYYDSHGFRTISQMDWKSMPLFLKEKSLKAGAS